MQKYCIGLFISIIYNNFKRRRYAYDFELITMVDFRIVLVVFIIDIKNTIFFQFK